MSSLVFESFCIFNRDAVLNGLCVPNEFRHLKPFLYALGLKLPYNSNAYWETFVPTTDPKLRVFLCHSSTDKPIVRELYQRLNAEGWIDPWLDEEKLLPGQNWDMEIEKAVENADAVIVSLSNGSVTKEGYIQKELRKILDIALEKPEETIFVIPMRLEDCEIPRRLRGRQYVDYFPVERREQVYQRLRQSLNIRFQQLNPQNEVAQETREEIKPPSKSMYTRLINLVFAKGDGTVDTVGTIPLIIYFALAALYILTPSDSTNRSMMGIFSILAGIFLVIRKQIPPGLIFKISTIIFVGIHALNYMSNSPSSKILEGTAALICCGSAIVTVRAPKKPVFYSSISLAMFLLFLGPKDILNAFNVSPSFLSATPIAFLGVIAIVLLVMDL